MVSKVIDIDCSVYSTDVKLAIFYMEIIELSKNKEIEKKKKKNKFSDKNVRSMSMLHNYYI